MFWRRGADVCCRQCRRRRCRSSPGDPVPLVVGFGDGVRQHLHGVGDVSAPRPRVSGQGAGDGSLAGGLVRVNEDFLAVGAQPDSPGLGLDDAVFGPEFARAQERHDGLVDQEGAELSHEVQRQGRLAVGACTMPSDGSSPAACSAPTHSDRRMA